MMKKKTNTTHPMINTNDKTTTMETTTKTMHNTTYTT